MDNIINQLVNFTNSLQKFSYSGYCQSGAVQYGLLITLHFGVLIYIMNKLTNQYSWVDRIWSLIPIIYAAHYLFYQTHCDFYKISLRQWIMLVCTTVWGLRLTYNYYRKGGYAKGGQDYRWIFIRERFHWFLVELLNIFFISSYQLVLIYAFSSPIYFSSNLYFNLYDIALTALWVLFFLGQVIADEQQWQFQTNKYKLLKQNNNDREKIPSPYNLGFIKSGLWKYSRHPNFFCEMMMWWTMYAFSVSSALLLTHLFIGSTVLTQFISSEKYPKYIQYKNQTSMLIPFFVSKTKNKID